MCSGGEENGEFPPKIPMSPFQSLAQPSASRLHLKTKQKVGSVGGSHYLQNRHFAKLLKASSKTPAIQGKGEEEEKRRRRRKGSQEKKVSKTTVWKRKKNTTHAADDSSKFFAPVQSGSSSSRLPRARPVGGEQTTWRKNTGHFIHAAFTGGATVLSEAAVYPLPSNCVQLSGTAVLSSLHPSLFH